MQQGMEIDAGSVAAAITGAAAAGASAFGNDELTHAVFGVPMFVVMAAFAGAMIALTFMQGSGFWHSIGTVASGTVGGAYLAPLVVKMAAVIVPGSPILESMDKPVAFLLGLGFQFAVPAFFSYLKRKGA